MSLVPDGKKKDLQIADQEITNALEQHTMWQGSPQRMWSAVEARLKPAPWYKQRMSWMPALAAAMILVLILFTQGDPAQPPVDPGVGQTEIMRFEDTAAQFRTMAAFDQPLAAEKANPVTVAVEFPDAVEAGSELNLEVTLTAAEGTAFTMETPIIRLMHTDKNGLFTVAAELSIDSWNQKDLAYGSPLSGAVSLTAPGEPGSYLVEVSVFGSIDGHPVFFGETKSLTVIENPKEE